MGHVASGDVRRFLMRRLDEDEHDALQVVHSRTAGGPGSGVIGGCWEPTRVLAECEAKRRIIMEQPEYWPSVDNVGATGAEPGTSRILRWLALPYAGHPDDDDRWRPVDQCSG